MNTTDVRSWDTDRHPLWSDSHRSASPDTAPMEWESNLLLPQMAAALEHPCAGTSANRLASLWRALRTNIGQPVARAR
ncbi:hypothetical protein [Pseudomonas chlororaphis]|uniref:hypothetical protein n=1 Tax=Pseudomonas chlororaphis TaxID=587753 RepID=UPI0003D3785E|nr:hypothetical protein [Pseudomonas chlororaphis]AZD28722.1 hypothetical protein C4K23_1962 [Pseudomonas chlororaphis]ETD37967.1 hypothetical protein U724_17795 [Pseudomonas chlororaphis subsp. aurantiaca PB-St2]QFS54276.1 hypothetical protein FD951_06720 [Pseudomonas chlororaphis subsp. aurantiaca]